MSPGWRVSPPAPVSLAQQNHGQEHNDDGYDCHQNKSLLEEF